ncbi:DNA alkylation repair protein [Sphingobacterium sp. N143]|uniref:DNA alkylation repair protein n=1 Tax=Sphingobacterium sp. N143 TaxID=2746727 RepID=UPI002577A06B|nr:DNA alkylation repair protein [Sphingobacterium sp. N143]MDM1296312.1 DNA alkylation repair protein [Sphingobacterium sp. N143]
MNFSLQAEDILAKITADTRLGDLRKVAAVIKKDHALALELWSTGQFLPRQLAILIMDKKQLSQSFIDTLDRDIRQHRPAEQLQLTDWLMANQLSKDKKTISFMETWENSRSSLLRRTFWYYQARLRWVGQIPPPNSEELIAKIESRIEQEVPEVQWAMNFTMAQIGIFEEKYRSRCIAFGERTGLYKDEIVPKNCTPNYLPQFIAIQVKKLKK